MADLEIQSPQAISLNIAKILKELVDRISELRKKAKTDEEIAAADRLLDIFGNIAKKI